MAEETTPKTTQATDNSKPISAMPELTTAQGSTLVPVVDGGNKKVKLSTIKSYINEGMVAQQTGKSLSTNDYTDDDKAKLGALPSKSGLDASLAAKLDKSEWDEEHVQFGHIGYYIILPEKEVFSPSIHYRNSGLLPINRQYDIVFKVWAGASASSIAFFEADGSTRADTLQSEMGVETTVTKENIPSSAAYFAISTPQGYAKNSYYRNGPTQEAREGAVSEAIQASKLALFVDQWNAACGSDGKYDPANAPDAQHPFYLNTLWLRYAEALAVYGQSGRDAIPYAMSGPYIKIRTNLPLTAPSWSGYLGGEDKREFLPSVLFIGNTFLEVVCISISHEIIIRDLIHMFERCSNLRKVIDKLILDKNTRTNKAFKNCAKLETITISGLSSNISFADSPLLSLASLQYLVTNAANTNAITVIVHPTVYAKLTDESSAEWNAVYTAAEAKQIEFATTE